MGVYALGSFHGSSERRTFIVLVHLKSVSPIRAAPEKSEACPGMRMPGYADCIRPSTEA